MALTGQSSTFTPPGSPIPGQFAADARLRKQRAADRARGIYPVPHGRIEQPRVYQDAAGARSLDLYGNSQANRGGSEGPGGVIPHPTPAYGQPPVQTATAIPRPNGASAPSLPSSPVTPLRPAAKAVPSVLSGIGGTPLSPAPSVLPGNINQLPPGGLAVPVRQQSTTASEPTRAPASPAQPRFPVGQPLPSQVASARIDEIMAAPPSAADREGMFPRNNYGTSKDPAQRAKDFRLNESMANQHEHNVAGQKIIDRNQRVHDSRGQSQSLQDWKASQYSQSIGGPPPASGSQASRNAMTPAQRRALDAPAGYFSGTRDMPGVMPHEHPDYWLNQGVKPPADRSGSRPLRYGTLPSAAAQQPADYQDQNTPHTVARKREDEVPFIFGKWPQPRPRPSVSAPQPQTTLAKRPVPVRDAVINPKTPLAKIQPEPPRRGAPKPPSNSPPLLTQGTESEPPRRGAPKPPSNSPPLLTQGTEWPKTPLAKIQPEPPRRGAPKPPSNSRTMYTGPQGIEPVDWLEQAKAANRGAPKPPSNSPPLLTGPQGTESPQTTLAKRPVPVRDAVIDPKTPLAKIQPKPTATATPRLMGPPNTTVPKRMRLGGSSIPGAVASVAVPYLAEAATRYFSRPGQTGEPINESPQPAEGQPRPSPSNPDDDARAKAAANGYQMGQGPLMPRLSPTYGGTPPISPVKRGSSNLPTYSQEYMRHFNSNRDMYGNVLDKAATGSLLLPGGGLIPGAVAATASAVNRAIPNPESTPYNPVEMIDGQPYMKQESQEPPARTWSQFASGVPLAMPNSPREPVSMSEYNRQQEAARSQAAGRPQYEIDQQSKIAAINKQRLADYQLTPAAAPPAGRTAAAPPAAPPAAAPPAGQTAASFSVPQLGAEPESRPAIGSPRNREVAYLPAYKTDGSIGSSNFVEGQDTAWGSRVVRNPNTGGLMLFGKNVRLPGDQSGGGQFSVPAEKVPGKAGQTSSSPALSSADPFASDAPYRPTAAQYRQIQAQGSARETERIKARDTAERESDRQAGGQGRSKRQIADEVARDERVLAAARKNGLGAEVPAVARAAGREKIRVQDDLNKAAGMVKNKNGPGSLSASLANSKGNDVSKWLDSKAVDNDANPFYSNEQDNVHSALQAEWHRMTPEEKRQAKDWYEQNEKYNEPRTWMGGGSWQGTPGDKKLKLLFKDLGQGAAKPPASPPSQGATMPPAYGGTPPISPVKRGSSKL